jgi:hypothetical protein
MWSSFLIQEPTWLQQQIRSITKTNLEVHLHCIVNFKHHKLASKQNTPKHKNEQHRSDFQRPQNSWWTIVLYLGVFSHHELRLLISFHPHPHTHIKYLTLTLHHTSFLPMVMVRQLNRKGGRNEGRKRKNGKKRKK